MQNRFACLALAGAILAAWLCAAAPAAAAPKSKASPGDKPQKAASLKDLAPRSIKEAEKLIGVRVSGKSIVAAIAVNPANASEFQVTALDASQKEAGQHIRWANSFWIQVRCMFVLDEDTARRLTPGAELNLAGDVAAVELLERQELLPWAGKTKKSKDRILTLRLVNVTGR